MREDGIYLIDNSYTLFARRATNIKDGGSFSKIFFVCKILLVFAQMNIIMTMHVAFMLNFQILICFGCLNRI
jgi:hypothetical protein